MQRLTQSFAIVSALIAASANIAWANEKTAGSYDNLPAASEQPEKSEWGDGFEVGVGMGVIANSGDFATKLALGYRYNHMSLNLEFLQDLNSDGVQNWSFFFSAKGFTPSIAISNLVDASLYLSLGIGSVWESDQDRASYNYDMDYWDAQSAIKLGGGIEFVIAKTMSVQIGADFVVGEKQSERSYSFECLDDFCENRKDSQTLYEKAATFWPVPMIQANWEW